MMATRTMASAPLDTQALQISPRWVSWKQKVSAHVDFVDKQDAHVIVVVIVLR